MSGVFVEKVEVPGPRKEVASDMAYVAL
jgi:hypothetical protein